MGLWHRRFSGGEYDVHIFYLVVPIAVAAFLAGMVGISGGGLIVPIAVILGGIPIRRIAMRTNTFLVLASPSMGFLGHAVNGGVDWSRCLIAGVVIIAGSQIGSHLHAKIDEKNLRVGLAIILTFAALWMVVRTIV